MHHFRAFLIVSLILNVTLASDFNTTGCPKCIEGYCPKYSDQCLLGLVEDICECCPQGVCAKIEGEECYSSTLLPPPPIETKKYGICGKNLNCLYRPDEYIWDFSRATCVCEDTRMVCSSGNKTYSSICELNLEAAKSELPSEELFVRNYGPCASVPVITSNPSDVTTEAGKNAVLTCEARGYPIPVITWDFVPENGGGLKQLPSDIPRLAVQSRGGPDEFMVTGWVQIVSISANEAGIYTCIAINDLGTTKTSAKIAVKYPREEV